MAQCLVALGSNLGDRVANLLDALAAIRELPSTKLLRSSSFHETAPSGGPPNQRNFFNAVATLESDLAPQSLLTALLEIETKLGRTRTERWSARTIDLDLLLYGDAVIESPALRIPHPSMADRRFVLSPAAEIAADWRHPLLAKSIGQLAQELPPAEDRPLLRVFTSPREMQAEILRLKREGKRVSLVPTMGALHEGHLSLVKIARQRSDVVVATIFVNPTQFGPQEDLAKYPRTLDADLTALSSTDCGLVFVPAASDMYPPGFSTYVEPPAVAEPLEGRCRPGHFRGVATIVLKLFQQISADLACFGQKDFQQLAVIRQMVNDLAVPIEIVACPTVREEDGLALSSRNRYLSPAERQQALALSRALNCAAELAAAGERDGQMIVAQMQSVLNAAGIERIDYVALADPDTLAEKLRLEGPTVALIAAYVGNTRLIDNRILITP